MIFNKKKLIDRLDKGTLTQNLIQAMQKLTFKFFIFGLVFIFPICLSIIALSDSIYKMAEPYLYKNLDDIPNCYTGLVLGAFVKKTGEPSDILEDRLLTALYLYKNKKIKRFLLSGDHGRVHYDEVNNMKNYLLQMGIPEADIFLDHAGFDTYDSIYRAKEIFEVKDVIIISQEFHLPRAIYIARNKGINAFGAISKNYEFNSFQNWKNSIRDKLACVKAFIEVQFNFKPRFLGEKIPITGDSKLSYD